MLLGLIVLFSLLGGALAVLLAATVLTVNVSWIERAMPRLVAFSTGTLLGAALIGMLPRAAHDLESVALFRTVLLTLVGFFLFERLLIWRHCHKTECEVHAASGPLLLIGDAVHNLVDGVVIAGAFHTSPSLGVATALSAIAHEVPQELSEFFVYLRSGYSRRKAFLLNMATSLTTLVGAVAGYFYFSWIHNVGGYFLAVAAGGFLYVALADLIPAQRGRTSPRHLVVDVALMALGVLVIAAVTGGHDH